MQSIMLNEQPYQTDAANLAALAGELQLPAATAAIVQGHVIPKASWHSTQLQPDMQVSFFQLVAGG